MMPFEPTFLQLGQVAAIEAGDDVCRWVAGLLASANATQWLAAQWKERRTERRLDAANKVIEEIMKERGNGDRHERTGSD